MTRPREVVRTQESEIAQDAATYALDLCARIAACTDVPGQITRLFLSPATRAVYALLREEMGALGMAVRIDAAGNLRGMYPGAEKKAPVLLLGSHVDTVPDAGAFDGVLGIAIALALVRALGGQRRRYAIEVIAFSEEEGVRFGLPFIGSRALVGTLDGEALARRDRDGTSLAEALRDWELDPEFLEGARLTPNTFAYLEPHIEQGPVLEALGLPTAIVTALVGQTRLELTFTGRANHAGTTPMTLRQDALAAAAGWIVEVERYAGGIDGLVATVGTMRAYPGAANVIPGRAVLSFDVRHVEDHVRAQATDDLLAAAAREAARRGVRLAWTETSRQAAVSLDTRLCDELAEATAQCGGTTHRMVSGAGHDAAILAGAVPSAMLFLRTPGGVSHHPAETAALPDVQAGCAVLHCLLGRLENLL